MAVFIPEVGWGAAGTWQRKLKHLSFNRMHRLPQATAFIRKSLGLHKTNQSEREKAKMKIVKGLYAPHVLSACAFCNV